MAQHRWWVLSVWGVVFVAAVLSSPHLLDNLSGADYRVRGSDSAKVAQLIQSDFTAAGAEQDVIVFDSATLTIKDSGYQSVVNRVLTRARRAR